MMRTRLLALPIVALVAAAADTFLTRLERAPSSTEPGLFPQALLLWAALAALALVPATISARLFRRRPPGGDEPPRATWARDALGLFGWTAFPVLAHQLLDHFTGIKQDVTGLFAPLPWLGVLVLAVALVLAGRALAGPLGRLAPRPVAAVLAVAALVVGVFLPRTPAPGPAPTGSPTAGPERPNLLLLVWDTTRAPSLDAYGNPRKTAPHLTALAEHGVLFEEVRSVSTFTLSSHVSMLTGVFPSHHTTLMTHMVHDSARLPGVAALLREHGYRTGGFVGTSVLRAETGLAAEFDVYDDRVDPVVCDTRAWSLVHDVQALLAHVHPFFDPNGRPHWFQDFQRPAREVLDSALAWIENGDPRPWFCFVNLYDAHWPYLPGPDGREQLVGEYHGTLDGFLFRSDHYDASLDGGVKGSHLDDDDKRHLRELYEGELWELDRDVDRFLGALDIEGGNTGVILTSDHGEALGEANHYEHSALLETQVRVPLVLVPPGGSTRAAELHASDTLNTRGARRRSDRASGVDVAATLLALAGVPSPPDRFGHDLTLPGEADRGVLVERLDDIDPRKHQLAFYRGHWKLVRTGYGEQARFELFDLSTDPLGTVDVSAENADVAGELADALAAYREQWAGEANVVDLEVGLDNADALNGLGYTGEQ